MKVFIAHSRLDRELVDAINDEVTLRGYDVSDSHKMSGDSDYSTRIRSEIRLSDAVVVILRDDNPNAYYELGLASASGKPILVGAPSGLHLPEMVKPIPYVLLSGDLHRDSQRIAARLPTLETSKKRTEPSFNSASEALQEAVRNPEYLESINSSEFELLVGQLFAEKGFSIHTGGDRSEADFDFAIESPDRAGVVLVEAKKLNPQSRVSVDTVRRLLAAMSLAGAAGGLLVSTSGITAAAAELVTGTSLTLCTLEILVKAKSLGELVRPKDRAHGTSSVGSQSGTAAGALTPRFKVRRVGQVAIVNLEGKITIDLGDIELKETLRVLLDSGEKAILLDLEKVEYLDSAGIGEVVACYKRAKEVGAKVKILNASGKIFDLLQLTKQEELEPPEMYLSVEDAVRSFG